MAKGFNLTAELNLRGPSNIKTVVSDIRRQIGTVSATVTPVLDKSSLKSISSEIKKQLGTITGNVNVRLSPSSAKNIANDVKKQLSSISANINIGVNAASVKSAGKTIKQQLSGLVVPIGVSASAASINQIKSKIKNQLGSLNVTVNVKLNSTVNQTLGAYNTNLTRLNNLLTQTATSATAAANSIDALAAAMRSASSVRLQPINTNLGNIGNNATRTGQAINGATGEVENFGRQAGLAIRRFAAFSTVAGVAYSITSALKSGVSAFIEYDQQLTKISQVTGDAKDKLGDITSTINNLSTSLGVSSSELASTTLTLAQAGLTAKDTERALKALALSALAPSFDDMNQTVEGSIALMRQFNIGSSQLESALGSINAVSAKFAVEASDIITAIQRTGGVFAASSRGVSEGTEALNEFISVFTSIRATTRESAETIATGLRTIFTRIQRAETIEALKEFGVTLTDLEGKFVGPYIAVQRLSEGLGRLDPRDLKFSSIVEELGGFRQIGKVLPLIQQFGTAQEALKVAQEGQGSLALDAAKGQQALAVQISKVRQEFLALIRSVGNTDSFQNIVKVGLDLASALIKVADAAKGLVPLLGLFAALRGAQAITQFAGGFGRGFRGAPTGQRAAEGGPIRRFASGGYVPGFGNGDTVSAKLTPGEFVMSRPAVRSIGVGNLYSLNRSRGGSVQQFDIGGAVERYQKGTTDRGVKKRKSSRAAWNPEPIEPPNPPKTLPLGGKTNFTHLHTSIEQDRIPKSIRKAANKEGINLTRLYSNMGLDLPENWNKNWNLKKQDRWGASSKSLKDYILAKGAEVFKTLLSTGQDVGNYRFHGRSGSKAFKILQPNGLSISQKLARKLTGGRFFDTDPEVESILPTLLKSSVYEALAQKSGQAETLMKGLEELTAYKAQGVKGRQSIGDNLRPSVIKSKLVPNILGKSSEGYKRNSAGGTIQKFMAGDLVEPVAATSAKKASTSEIIKLLGLETAAKIGGISATDVYTTLNKRTPTPQQSASKAAILAEFTKKQNRLSGAKQARTTRITSKGLLFGAAGMLGSAFAPINKKITSDQLKAPVDVRIISGIMDPKVASATEQSFTSSLNKTAGMAAKKVMIADILAKAGLGKELNLDFDRTLAFGADKILSDPKTPKFAEFGDRSKVAAALKGAKLSLLGKELAGLVSSKPELLGNLKLITARPASTLDLVQGWLSSKGLPIPLSQFKGLGGPGVSGSQIAKLKAALLSPGSLFVDDDARNIKAAKARSKEGIEPYRYGNRKISSNPNAEATAQGTLFEKMIQKLGGPGALKGQGMDFPQGLKGAAKYFGIPGNIATDAKRTISGPSTVEDNIITYLKTKGYSAGGSATNTVPALVSDGEAYIPPEEAKNIGLDKLREMNRADRNGMRSFARGGISVFRGPGTGTSDSIGPVGLPVGSFIVRAAATKALGLSGGGPVGVQQLASGGAVQRFFLGGSPVRPRPDNPTAANIRVSDSIVSQLREVTEALTRLGITSSSTADLFRKGGAISYQAATRSMEADLLRMRIAGASAATLYQAEQRLNNVRQAQAKDLNARQQLKGLSGEQLQQIDTRSSSERQKLIKKERNKLVASGLSSDEVEEKLSSDKVQDKINRKAYQKATTQTLGASTANNLFKNGVSGSDIDQYTRQAMMDRKTLAQMDSQLRSQKQQELTSSTTYKNASAAQQKKMLASLKQETDNEINARRKLVNDLAKQGGMSGPGSGGRMSGQGMMSAAFGVQMIGSLIAQNINAESSSGNAQLSAGLQGGTNMLATGAMIGGGMADMLPSLGKLAGPIGAVAVAAAAAAQGLIDARNASIQFEQNLQKKRVESALEDSQKLFEKLNTNIKNVDIQRSLSNKLEEAGDAAKAGIEANNKLAKAFWVNLFDAFGSADQGAASQRSEILEKKGIMAYLGSTDFFGEGDKGRSREYETLIPGKAKENSKNFSDASKLTSDLIGAKIQSGSSVEDIFKDPAWTKQAEVIARANAAIEQEILSIRNSASISNFEKEARIKNIIAINAEETVRQQASVIERQQQLKSLDNTTNIYTRSLERMFQNMEQSIGQASFSLTQMSKDIELVSDSLQGQAKLGNIDLTAINALQNPRAYSDQTISSSRSVAAESFGIRSPEMVSLLGVGEKIESAVMSAINKSVNKNPGITDEALGFTVSRDVKTALTDLSLPPDLVNKLSGEVGNALKDFKKSGEDKLDYSQLSEKLAQLNKVVDSSKRAQEVAIKALEHYQNALNLYSQNINKTIDLQISANQRLRKATDIVTDSELSLAKTLGKNISLENARATVNSRVGSRTGGLTNPNDIFDNINKLETTRVIQQAEQRSAAEKGVSGQSDFIQFTNNLSDTNTSLRENIDALKYLSENTDIAAAALEKIQEAQQKASGRASFIEKLVTSTPEELDSLSGAFQRLQNNANGQINTINRSTGAQKAYYEALQNGATMMEAMKAAQAAFVNERKETLGALNDILPFLGNSQQAGNIKANVLESMLQESGMGVSPLFQQVLNTLRNPEMDPATQAAIAEYREGNNLQARANALLAQLDSNLARDIANQSAKALANAMSNVKLNFENQELKDLVNQVQQINGKLPLGAAPAVGKASGGVIYAAAGQAIDFKSKGTDTVPAMLTPGEFVVNRASTQRNLPLLNQINSNKYSSGGPVKYYSSGGYVSQNFKDEYQKNSDDLVRSKEKYIDPKSAAFSNIKSVYAGPDKFVRGAQPKTIFAPLATASSGSASLDSIQSETGINNLYLGEAPAILVEKNAYDQEAFNYGVINRPRAHLLDSLGSVVDQSFDTKKITKKQFIEYKDAFNRKLVDSSLDASTIISSMPLVNDISKIPESLISDQFYNPNVISDKPVGMIVTRNKALGALSWNKESTQHSKVLKIYRLASDYADATVVSNEDQGYYKIKSDLKMSDSSAQDRIRILTGDNSWITEKDKIQNIVQTQELNLEDLNKTQTFASLNPADPVFNSLFTAEDPDLSNLRQKLEMLYSGADGISLMNNELNFFNPKALTEDSENITLLHILSDKYKASLQRSLNTEDQAKTAKKAFPKLMIGGAGLLNLPDRDYPWARGYEFGISDRNDATKPMKAFPWIANADPSVISQDIQASIDNQAEQLKTKYAISTKPVSDFGSHKLKLPNPIGDIDLPYHMQYTEYSGPQIATDPSKADPNGFNLGAKLNNVLLMTPNNKNPLSPFAQFKKYATSTAYVNKILTPNEIFDRSHVELDKIPDFATLAKGNIDRNQRDQLKENLKSIQYKIDLNSLTDHANHPILKNIPLFEDSAPNKQSYVFNIGEYLSTVADKVFTDKDAAATKAVGEIDDKGQLAGDVIKDNDLPRAVKDLAKLSLGVFGRKRVPGLPGNWLYNSIRGVLQKPFKDSGVAKQAAGYTSNVFGNFGGYLSRLAPMARNANVYQQLKELFTLGSGAAMAFAGLASGDTRMIGQFTKLNLNAEDLFRTLGGASLFGRISSTQLSGDYQAILGQQLEGAKIKTVGANGTLSPVSADKAIPEKYSDLVNIAFNPYNEFPSKDTRNGIIKKLTMDMINARDPLGMPYFDSNTQRFLYDNMSSLYNWYGGNGAWKGQDYFFDKKVNPDNAKRTEEVINSLRDQAGQDAYTKGNVAHNTLGFAYRYGSLPTDAWFVQRREAGLNAEARAVTDPNASKDPLRFATGGVVYAQEGQMINFQPRGTDTVPAMLTPGEFVINRQATQRNLPLLKSINNGGVQGFSSGGVAYLSRGGQPNDVSSGRFELSDDQAPFSHRSINPLTGNRTSENGDDLEKKYRINSGIYDYLTLRTKMPDWLTSLNNLSFDDNSMRFFSDASFYKTLTQIREANDLRSLQSLSYDFVKGFKYRDYNKDNRLSGFDFTSHLSKTDGILGLIDPDVGGDLQPKDLVKWTTTKARLRAKSAAARVVQNLTPDLENLRDILSDQKPAEANNNPEFKARNHYESPAALIRSIVSQWKKDLMLNDITNFDLDNINEEDVVKDILARKQTPNAKNLVDWLENNVQTVSEKVASLVPVPNASEDWDAAKAERPRVILDLIKNGPEAFMTGLRGETKEGKGKSLIYSLLAQSARVQGINNLIKARSLFSGSDTPIRKDGDMARRDGSLVYKDQTRTPENFEGRENNVSRAGQVKTLTPADNSVLPGSGPNGEQTPAEQKETSDRARMADKNGRSAIRGIDLWDTNKDGKISFEETGWKDHPKSPQGLLDWLADFTGVPNMVAEDLGIDMRSWTQKRIFDEKFDKNKSGFIEPEEYGNFVGKPLSFIDLETDKEAQELGNKLGETKDPRGAQKLAYDRIDRSQLKQTQDLLREDFKKLHPATFEKASEYLDREIIPPQIEDLRKLSGVSKLNEIDKRQLLSKLESGNSEQNKPWGLEAKTKESLGQIQVKIKRSSLFGDVVNKAYTQDLNSPQNILYDESINYENALKNLKNLGISKETADTIMADPTSFSRMPLPGSSKELVLESAYLLENELNSTQMAEDEERSKESNARSQKSKAKSNAKKDFTKKFLTEQLFFNERYFEEYTKLWRGMHPNYYDMTPPALDRHVDMHNNLFKNNPQATHLLVNKPTADQEENFFKGLKNISTDPIYASNGMLIPYQPRGTDTVPAMLTPGEFVVNAKATRSNLSLLQSINKSKGGVVYAAEGGMPTKPDGSADASFNSRKDQRSKYLEAKIQEEERLEFRKLSILYNDTTDKKDIIEALKKQRDYKTKIDYYLRQFSTDNQFGLRLKRYPRISEAGKSILAKQEQPKANPFDQGQQPAATPQSLEKGGVIYASEGTLVNYQPRGTDTVPAMLTPGEFVVNAKAAGQNLSLLKSINNGTKGYSKGGIIYLEGGGKVEREGLDVMAIHLGEIVKRPYAVDMMSSIKDIRKAREERGETRETTRKKKMTKDADGKPVQEVDEKGRPVYENVTKDVKTAEQAKKDREQAKKDAHAEYYEAAKVKEREQILEHYKSNEPLQKQAMNEAEAFRATFLAARNKFINEIEDKVRAGAKETGVSLLEFLENNDQANAEYGFIRGKFSIENAKFFDQQFGVDLENLISQFPAAFVSSTPEYLKDFNLQSTSKAQGRYAYYKAAGAVETYEAQASETPNMFGYVLPNGYSFRSEKGQDEIRGPGYVAPEALSSGGVVYASNGMLIPYEPKGTDTVPAMLTPGEFVVNRAATQANLPLLKAINNGQTKAYSKGGVVYLDEGGLSQRDKVLSQSPAGQLILKIKEQAESYPKLFEALDSSAFSNITSGKLYDRYDAVWKDMDAGARYTAAKTQFQTDKTRVDYLTGVYNNASQAYATLKGNQLAVNTKVGSNNIPLLTLLKGQEAAMSEAQTIHETWIRLAKTYPDFRADVGGGGAQAAGTGAVAGTPPPPDKGADKPPEKDPVNKRYGGMVYAAAGGNILPFTPISRGTDTVPAMLTPGEFVVNRTSTQRNLPLLQAINNNRYANGGQVGRVNYLEAGGQPAGGGVSTGGGSASPNTDGLSQFTTTFQSFIDQLKNLNPVINLKGEHNVNVNFNGAQYLAAMDESIRKIVVSEVNAAMDKLNRDTEGAVGGR
jgi:TP901 family phage tail tape measure protein